jgi:hypothetical protein
MSSVLLLRPGLNATPKEVTRRFNWPSSLKPTHFARLDLFNARWQIAIDVGPLRSQSKTNSGGNVIGRIDVDIALPNNLPFTGLITANRRRS